MSASVPQSNAAGIIHSQKIQDAALLHTLATHPERALPAGKTLRVGLLKPAVEADASSLEARVTDAMHKAFWDQVRDDASFPRIEC